LRHGFREFVEGADDVAVVDVVGVDEAAGADSDAVFLYQRAVGYLVRRQNMYETTANETE